MAFIGKIEDKSKVSRLPVEVVEYIKSKRLEGESFNDTHARLLGINYGEFKVKSSQLSKNPEIMNILLKMLNEFHQSGQHLGREKYMVKDFTEFVNIRINQGQHWGYKEAVELPKKYPQLMQKTNNGQTRLAHLVKTIIRRYEKDLLEQDNRASF